MRSGGVSLWLDRFFGLDADGWSHEAVDNVDVARLLTHRQAMDLRWALEALQQAEQGEASGAGQSVTKARRGQRGRGFQSRGSGRRIPKHSRYSRFGVYRLMFAYCQA